MAEVAHYLVFGDTEVEPRFVTWVNQAFIVPDSIVYDEKNQQFKLQIKIDPPRQFRTYKCRKEMLQEITR